MRTLLLGLALVVVGCGGTSVGSGAYAGATVASLTGGFHTLTGSTGFSVQIYGSADRTSYSYAAGLNLVPQP